MQKVLAVTDFIGPWRIVCVRHNGICDERKCDRRRGLPFGSLIVEADSLHALVVVVARTALISMINMRSVRKGALPEGVVVRPLTLDDLERRIGIVRRVGYLSPIALRAQEILRQAAAGLGEESG